MFLKLLNKINNNLLSYSLKDRIGFFEKEMKFINSLNKPKDLFERSYFQYKAQKFIIGNYKFIILNIFLFPLVFIVIFLWIFKFFFPIYKIKKTKNKILTDIAIPETIPNELIKNKKQTPFINKFSISKTEILFISKLTKRYWNEPYFLLKNIAKILIYSKNIKLVKPSEIIVQNEYSFTSSILTEFCRTYKILHINVMHGEKLLLIRDSFFEYDKCYVWNKHYKNIFIELKANPKQFIIKMPEDFCKYSNEGKSKNKKKYYLNGSETLKDILIIKNKIPNIIFRPHPIYSKTELLTKNKINFEAPLDNSINNSISESKIVCAKYSTVLFQAWLMGTKVIIDDLTDNKLFMELKERKYFLLTQNVQLLSDFRLDKF